MKKLKFRAWDKQNKEWMYAGLKNGKRSFPLTVSIPTTLILDDRFGDKYENTVWCLDNDELIWCQYIGLEDKNGVEVYIGDIVSDEYGNIFEIIDEFEFLAHLSSFRFQVIGNIHENCEL